jgi:hypothetical protein
LQWDAGGITGNGDGWLMAAQDFDDGRCYQINTSVEASRKQSRFPNHPPGQPDAKTEQWCETNIRVHDKVQVNSTITIYWVWAWATAPGTNVIACGKGEYYTSCLDFDVVDGNLRNLQDRNLESTQALSQQDPQSEAVHAYKSRNTVRERPALIAEGSCGKKSDPTVMYIPTDTKITVLTGSSQSLLVPRQNTTRATIDLEHKSILRSAEEQSMTLHFVKTTTATSTITTTMTVTPTITLTS